jgi:nitrogen fixation protein NifU and related proteins
MTKDRWPMPVYSERLLDLFHSHTHAGRLEDATHCGEAGTPGHGPSLRLWLRVQGETVVAARFMAYGCPAALACGEALCALVEGRRFDEVGTITAEAVVEAVGGVPEGKEHCPPLAARAVQAAVIDRREVNPTERKKTDG